MRLQPGDRRVGRGLLMGMVIRLHEGRDSLRQTDPCVRFPVLCAGLPRSASTWAFNVAAGLAEADSRWSQVTRLYSDDGLDDAAGTRMAEPGLVLIKTHAPSAMLRCAFAWSGAPVMLTVRDPRDSAASLMQQFGFAFEEAVRAVSSSAAALLHLVSVCRPLVLRYEDGFAADPGSVAQVGEFLGLSVAERVRDQIWRELSSEHVSRRLAVMAFSEAPEGALALPAADPETHWHPNHIGDGLIGKYRTMLTAAQIAVVEYEAGPFMRHFGYPVAALPRGLTSGARVDFSAEGVGASYLGGWFFAHRGLGGLDGRGGGVVPTAVGAAGVGRDEFGARLFACASVWHGPWQPCCHLGEWAAADGDCGACGTWRARAAPGGVVLGGWVDGGGGWRSGRAALERVAGSSRGGRARRCAAVGGRLAGGGAGV